MISIIVAVAQNGVIGSGNRMPWHIAEDLQRFKAITTGHPVIMGRKTFESLGRPLPNRTNVVITRNPDWKADGVKSVSSLWEAVLLFPKEEEVFIIGGGEIYRQALPIADKVYLTVIHDDYEGDTCFPALDPAQWQAVSTELHPHGENFPHSFEFTDYIRK